MRLIALLPLLVVASAAVAQDAPPRAATEPAAAAGAPTPGAIAAPSDPAAAAPDTTPAATPAQPEQGTAPGSVASPASEAAAEPAPGAAPQPETAAPQPETAASPPAGSSGPGDEAPAATAPGSAPADPSAAAAVPAGPSTVTVVPAVSAAESAGDGAGAAAATAARPLAIGLLDNAPPFSSAARYGVRVGFDVDLAYGLCTRLQRRCRYLPMDRAELTQALRDRRIDAVLASDGRSEYGGTFASFSEPYLSLAARFVVPRASSADLESDSANAYGAVIGTPHAQYLQATYKDPSSVALYASQEEMWIDLALGRLEGALATAVTARLEFLDTPLGNDFRFASGSLANAKVRPNQAAVAVRKNDPDLLDQLNKALDEFMNSPEYAEALNRHLTGGLATRPVAPGGT